MEKGRIFALDLDEEALRQFNECTSHDFVLDSALMPDAHSGYVAPIGSVFLTRNYVVPAWVGYDIGCGMIAVRFLGEGLVNLARERAEKIFRMVFDVVPMGMSKVNHISDVSEKSKLRFRELLDDFKKGAYKDEVFDFIRRKGVSHIGSLGSGNHFVELGFFEDELWLVVHSGSRGIGHTIATYYMKQSSGLEKGYEKTSELNINSRLGLEYLNVHNFALEFALLNRLEIADKVLEVLRGVFEMPKLDYELWVNKNHNHALLIGDKVLHRKGATPAEIGERGVIPANMRDGSFLVLGFGSEKFMRSSSHGAGRVLSRNEAKKKIELENFKKSMKGIFGKIDMSTIDEAPMAYKDIYSVMELQKESVEIVKQIRPIINWKG